MIHTYLSTFITGFKDVIKNHLPEAIDISQIVLLWDGLVIYKTSADVDQIKKINYLNNSFVLLKRFRQSNQSVDRMMRDILSDRELNEVVRHYIKNKSSFRVIVSRENQIISVNKELVRKIEQKISRNKYLMPNRAKPDIEFWLLIRSEEEAFFGIRVTKKPNQEKYLEKGELRPELASILCLLSEPRDDDVFLDPFCGSGAIPIQRLLMPNCRYKKIIASDKDPEIIKKLKAKVGRSKNKSFVVKNLDVLNQKSFAGNSIDKIVTDPPWGLHFDKIGNIERFYSDMIENFYRILKGGGILIVIIAKKEIFQKVLGNNIDKFILLKEYSTLVSGQKAGVYKMRVSK